MESVSVADISKKVEMLVELLERALIKRDLYPPRLTKYEVARVVGARAVQLAMGAQPLVDIQRLGTTDPVIIAMEEFKEGLLDFIVVREFPDGKSIRIALKELQELEKSL